MSKKTTFEDFKMQIERFQPNRNFTFIGYEAMMKPLTVICNDCGYQKYYSTAQSFRNIKSHFQCNCPQYSKRGGGFKKRLTMADFQERIDSTFGKDKLRALTFNKMLDPAEVQCVRCGRIRTVKAANKILCSMNPCFYCDNPDKMRFKDYQDQINERFDTNEYEIIEIEEHTGRRERKKVKIRHSCGFIYNVGYEDFLKSKGCPKCTGRSSKGEIKIASVLNKKNINYKREYQKGMNHKFRFDFAIFNQDNSLIGLIEYDGQQHFPDIVVPPGWLPYEEQHKQDLLKNEKAKELGIPLLRIPYFDIDKVETLIDDFLTFIDYPVREQGK